MLSARSSLNIQPQIERFLQEELATSTPKACPWVATLSKNVREHPENFPDFSLINGQLYRRFSHNINDDDDTPWKLCVPTPLRPRVLQEHHDQPTGGHLGIRKTIHKVTRRYYWPGMSRDISRYVRRCKLCQRHKVSQQQPAGKMLRQIPDEPWASNQYSPAFLTQGREQRLPNALYDEVTLGTGTKSTPPTEREDELREIFQLVRKNLEQATQQQRKHYNLRRRDWRPKIGEQVLIRNHPLSSATEKFAAKLAPKFNGPYTVTSYASPVIVNLQGSHTDGRRTAHLSDVKTYFSATKQ